MSNTKLITLDNLRVFKEQYDTIVNDIRETAEGKCQVYILSYADTIEIIKNRGATVYDGNGTDITGKIQKGDYDSATIKNSVFNSQNATVAAYDGMTAYLIVKTAKTNAATSIE